MVPGTEGYAEAASRLLGTRLSFAEVHGPYLHLLPRPPASVLDIGSGPGHDAAALAGMGFDVVAAEPTSELLRGASDLHCAAAVTWVEDGLPELKTVSRLGRRFAFILASGVWMHLDEAARQAAMPKVAALLDPRGVFALSLRHGPVPHGRRMFEVSGDETVELAALSGLTPVVWEARGSIQPANRAAGVTWTLLAFRRPE